jgi:hypothetical protein
MTSSSIEQVIVGKMSLPKVNGQISLLVPPESFAWLQHFSAEEIAEFFIELMEALNQSQHDEDWSHVTDVVEAWRATANIKADPAVVAGVDQGLAELDGGQGDSWTTLQDEVGL